MTKNQKKAAKRYKRKLAEMQVTRPDLFEGADYRIRVPGQDVHVLTRGVAHGSIEGPRGLNTYPRDWRDQNSRKRKKRVIRRADD